MPANRHPSLRNATAWLTLACGTAQVALLWVLDLGAPVLVLALAGCIYLLLALGLFGRSRLPLALAVILPAARVVSGWSPLPVVDWEQLRTIAEIAMTGLALFLLFQSYSLSEASDL